VHLRVPQLDHVLADVVLLLRAPEVDGPGARGGRGDAGRISSEGQADSGAGGQDGFAPEGRRREALQAPVTRPRPRRTPASRGAIESPSKGSPARKGPHKRPLKTLERVLSKAGVGSRVEARRWVHAGRVTVNGRVVRDPDQWVDMQRDRVGFDDAPLEARARVYVLLYKPTGYITTYRDPKGRPTVYDLVADVGTFLAPVGRLDLDTSGLLLMTNDTQFAERVTNPASHVPKTYLVKASRLLTDEELTQLREGIDLSDGPTRPASVKRVRDSAKYTHIEITLTEGRNRQVRRMIEALDATVLKLVRVRVGPVAIGALPIGKWRLLSPGEVAAIAGSGG
jgi:pseudouridine synthase